MKDETIATEPTPAPSSRTMRLRFAGTCNACATSLRAGERAEYDKVERAVTCLPCAERARALAMPLPAAGDAGASAADEHARRKARHEARVRRDHPILGELKLFLSDDPQHVRAWTVGARGEAIMGRRLNALADKGVVVLHDRRIPGSKANIDHIAIGPSGIYVIDAKKYTGRIEVARKSWFGERLLWVGKRDCSKLADAMPRQAHVILEALDGLPEADGVVVTMVLAFVKGDWPLFGAPDTFRGVRIEGENSTSRLVARHGPLTAEQIHLIAHRLHARLPSAAR